MGGKLNKDSVCENKYLNGKVQKVKRTRTKKYEKHP